LSRLSGALVGVECALRRVRTRKGRLLATGTAIAIGVAGLMLVSVAGTVAGDRALQRGIEALVPTERAFTVTVSPDLSPTSSEISVLNDRIDSRLQAHGFGPTLRTVEYRALPSGDGRSVRFAGIDDLQNFTRLVDGTWPTRCDPERCEVVAVVPASADPRPVEPFAADSPLGLTIVGTAVSTNVLVLNGQLLPLADEQIVLADGVAKASSLPDYELFRRTYAWQAPLIASDLRTIDVDPLFASVRAIGSDSTLPGVFVSGPEDDLLSIRTRTRITGNRLAVPIGAVLVLFFGVAVLAGLAGRADHRRASSLLRRRGASGSEIFVFRVLESVLPVLAGALLGLVSGALVGSWLGRHTGLGGWSVLDRSIGGSVILGLVAVAVSVWLLIFGMLSINDSAPVRRGRRPLASDVAGAAALIVLAVLIARGSVSSGSLNQKVDPALVAVPVLAAIVLSAIVMRLVPVGLRAASTSSPRRWPLTKLTLAEATAQPLRSVATASLIAVTVMFAFLTFGYASTLRLGSRDQAAFAVPYDFRVQTGSALVRPQALMPDTEWSALVPGTTATDVLRRGVAVQRSATGLQTTELLGLDPATLAHLHGWRSSFGQGPTVLAKVLESPKPPAFGSPIPSDAASLEFDGTGFENLHIAAAIARADGTWHELTLDEVFEGGVRAELTPGDAGGQLVGFRVAQPPEESARIDHHVGEGNTSVEAKPIDIVLQRVQTAAADGTSTAIPLQVDRLRAADAVVEAQPDSGVRVSGSILGVSILVTPLGPGQDVPLGAVVDPITATAAVDGIVVVETSSGSLQLRVSAVVDRFPGLGSRFIIVDNATLQPALDLLQPGAGTANELWLAADSAAHERSLADTLGDSSFDVVDIDRRIDRQTALATDPLAVVTLLILTASALVAMVLGACAVFFGAAADAADDRPLLRMLALERVRSRRLVTMVAAKSMAAVVVAIPLGLIGGRWLLQIATRLVAVSATSVQPNPPLRLAVPWLVVGLVSVALLVVLALGALTGALAARSVPDEDLLRGTS
jgi:hypothetical protein